VLWVFMEPYAVTAKVVINITAPLRDGYYRIKTRHYGYGYV
jgi:hypothetical protein